MSALNKYAWVVNTLLRAGERGLSLKELNERWVRNEMSNGEPIPRQTFDRWKGAILNTWGVIIDCKVGSGYRYYIMNPDALKKCELEAWMLDTYSTFDILSNNTAIKDRILLEEIPSNRYFLTDILDAMNNNNIIEMTYTNFIGGDTYTHRVAPYCVKMSMKRWYMLALNTYNDALRIYGLDRIEDVRLTEETFKFPKKFDAKKYFSTLFGVVNDETTKVERIVLRAGRYHQNYLRSLPLHPSQHEIFTSDEYADFELRLRPTFDFCFELLSRGAMIEVIKPQSLRHIMHGYARDLWQMYKKD